MELKWSMTNEELAERVQRAIDWYQSMTPGEKSAHWERVGLEAAAGYVSGFLDPDEIARKPCPVCGIRGDGSLTHIRTHTDAELNTYLKSKIGEPEHG